MIMLNEMESLWNSFKDMPLQEKFKRLIFQAKKHWMVTFRNQQMQNVVMALGSVYKKESEEKFQAFTYFMKYRVRIAETMQEMLAMDEIDMKDMTDLINKYHDVKDPEKMLLPLNWNKLWLKPIVFEDEPKKAKAPDNALMEAINPKKERCEHCGQILVKKKSD